MPKRDILILQHKDSPWREFLQEFFEDTRSELHFFHDAPEAREAFDRLHPPILFADPGLMSVAFRQRIMVQRQTPDPCRVFALESGRGMRDRFPFEDVFGEIPSLADFQRRIHAHLIFPEKVRVLVADDDPEIGSMIRDYFEARVNPVFEVSHVENGEIALRAIEKQKPDVMVLDIKMPVMDGREVFREVRKRGWDFPVIIFFDAISGDEIAQVREFGRPAVVEKGARLSAMPEMMQLVKKLVYFS